jgi:hypothetical protein
VDWTGQRPAVWRDIRHLVVSSRRHLVERNTRYLAWNTDGRHLVAETCNPLGTVYISYRHCFIIAVSRMRFFGLFLGLYGCI